jgi:ADP-ribose pyrophosphatase
MEAPKRKSISPPVYQCRIFSVYEDDVRLPDGRVVRQTRIEHKPTVSIVPVDAHGDLIMLRQYRSAIDRYLLEIPAGTMDKGKESVEECAQRELAEETGFKAGRLLKLFEGYLVPGYCNEYMYFYLACELKEEPLPADDDEIIELVRISMVDALNMIKNGEIIDSKTALGILMARETMASS